MGVTNKSEKKNLTIQGNWRNGIYGSCQRERKFNYPMEAELHEKEKRFNCSKDGKWLKNIYELRFRIVAQRSGDCT